MNDIPDEGSIVEVSRGSERNSVAADGKSSTPATNRFNNLTSVTAARAARAAKEGPDEPEARAGVRTRAKNKTTHPGFVDRSSPVLAPEDAEAAAVAANWKKAGIIAKKRTQAVVVAARASAKIQLDELEAAEFARTRRGTDNAGKMVDKPSGRSRSELPVDNDSGKVQTRLNPARKGKGIRK